MAQNSKVLPPKEQSLFRHLVQNYESKQYKKGLKAADQILRKHPDHGDTQAMKALILMNQGFTTEAFDLCKLALKNSMKSHVCWHVYGLLYRQQKNYDEAIKAYRFALKLDPDSAQILRDLALMQIQTRDYKGYVTSRRTMLQARPQLRLNWTALAVGLHLDGDLKAAEDVLTRYEESSKIAPSRGDVEHHEAVLYKNIIIAEQGDLERALQHLESVYKTVLDRTAVMEMKADYLLRLGRLEAAEKAYNDLLARNPERRAYYSGLERAKGLDRSRKEDREKLLDMYSEWERRNERIDAARRIPLDFTEGTAFRERADAYLKRMFRKGVPSTFANLKELYADSAKMHTVQDLVEGYASANDAGVDGDEANKNWQLGINFFLAQHYNHPLSRDSAKAQQYIDRAIQLNSSSTDYTYHMTRARILKNLGAVDQAAVVMNEAREMDLKDRYINTKCAKYQLRNEQNQDAIDTMGLFTRKEAVGGPLGDLLDMQCVWFLVEDGESYLRQGRLALALKRFQSIYTIFETWYDDQIDFHTFSLRRGMVRAYVDMMRWEDRLRDHPYYTRAALSAIRLCLTVHDRPEAKANGEVKGKKAKPAKKTEVPSNDKDLQGLEAFEAMQKQPLDEAMKFLNPLLELSRQKIDGQLAGFEIYIRRKKYLPALKCLLAAQKLDPAHPRCYEQSVRFQHALKAVELPDAVKNVIDETFKPAPELDSFLQQHNDSAAHLQSAVRVRGLLGLDADESGKKESLDMLCKSLTRPGASIKLAQDGVEIADALGGGETYRKAASQRWPEAKAFR
ncbi:N-terminal acetyltransferase A, auxiliary subunit [Piedraia hortae CBS 480.64]|uniref:N-terminal acetyltransferase A, auxiliary subunit n=1 Tax=Piedraia hortae CBS 480.64 TaxID=1314780 RepID=A0A6A7C5H9_9PEZI|nr:N-terminal acetyltransferase A, auxiliary subunit [Piedraia hortae CBS 480.64]